MLGSQNGSLIHAIIAKKNLPGLLISSFVLYTDLWHWLMTCHNEKSNTIIITETIY